MGQYLGVSVVADRGSSPTSKSLECSIDLHTTAAPSEKSPGAEMQSCLSPEDEATQESLRVQDKIQGSNGRWEHEHDTKAATLHLLEEQSEPLGSGGQLTEATDRNALPADNPVELLKKPSLTEEDAIESELHRWMVDGERQGKQLPSQGHPQSYEDNWCPSHEFEYWAVEVSRIVGTLTRHNTLTDLTGCAGHSRTKLRGRRRRHTWLALRGKRSFIICHGEISRE